MANREKGEIGIEIGGRIYTLVIGVNEMVALEEHFSRNGKDVVFGDILKRVNAGSMKHQRAFIWASLLRHHPDLTVEQVGDLIEAAGGILAFASQLMQLTGATMPDEKDVEALGGAKTGRPQRAQARADGTGTASTVTPAASA